MRETARICLLILFLFVFVSVLYNSLVTVDVVE